ncbi:hypothetical protein [Virgifigura deserti]|uniref:hypothetical protein n=1 Tax=Virgifigura deserti TaxID=2268457 RepID=UPI003CCBED75
MRDGTDRHGRSASSDLCKCAAAGLLVSAFLCGSSVPLAAAEPDMLRLAGLSALSDTALDDLRGGFFVGPFFINFGMKITTMVNDVRVLETSFNVTQPNQISNLQTTVIQDMPPAGQGAGQGAGEGAGDGAGMGAGMGAGQGAGTGAGTPGSSPTTPSGMVDLGDLTRGIELDLGQGTRILQRLDNGLVTEIVNSANGQTIRHATEVNLFITNFSTVIDQGRLHIGLNNLARESARIGLTFGQ